MIYKFRYSITQIICQSLKLTENHFFIIGDVQLRSQLDASERILLVNGSPRYLEHFGGDKSQGNSFAGRKKFQFE